jgi:hypothetical protein
MLDHLPLARNHLQGLRHVLADLAQSSAATAWAGRRRRIDHPLARQMLGQRPARRLAPLEAVDRDCHGRQGGRLGCHLGFGCGLFQIGELKLELLDQPGAALRGSTEPVMAQLGDGELELLNHQRAGLRLGFGRRPRGTLCHQHRLQRSDIVGERIIGARHAAMESQSAALVIPSHAGLVIHPAACGRHVCCGARQSIPSRR